MVAEASKHGLLSLLYGNLPAFTYPRGICAICQLAWRYISEKPASNGLPRKSDCKGLPVNEGHPSSCEVLLFRWGSTVGNFSPAQTVSLIKLC